MVDELKKKVEKGLLNDKEFGFNVTNRELIGTEYVDKYNTEPMKGGTEFGVSLEVGQKYTGSFHNHPYNGESMFSFGDLYLLLKAYDWQLNERKPEIFAGLVAPNFYISGGGGEVYMLKIDNITKFRAAIKKIWTDPLYKDALSEEVRYFMISNAHREERDKSPHSPETFFLKRYSNGTIFDAGISLYKADATMTKFDKLSLINGKAEPTPCK